VHDHGAAGAGARRRDRSRADSRALSGPPEDHGAPSPGGASGAPTASGGGSHDEPPPRTHADRVTPCSGRVRAAEHRRRRYPVGSPMPHPEAATG
jgi:hypothetical protein